MTTKADKANVNDPAGGMNGGVHITDEDIENNNEPNTSPWDDLGVTKEQYDKYFDDETNQYDWKSHAKEAEFKAAQAKGKSKEEPKDKSEGDKADEGGASEDEAKTIVERAGLSWDKLGDDVINTGSISDDDRKKLNDVGIPDSIIDEYVEGVKNTAAVKASEVLEALGGDDGLEAITKAIDAAGWTDEQRRAAERELAGPNWQAKAEELRGMVKGNTDQNAGDKGNQGGSDAPEGYASQSELNAAIQDPRYRMRGPKGDAYRREVMAKARASTFNVNPRSHSAGF